MDQIVHVDAFQFEHPHVFPSRPQPQTKLVGATSLWCPEHFLKRKRAYYRSKPLKRFECNPKLPERQPRVSNVWYLFWLRWLIAPHAKSLWRECSELATCPHPKCSPVWVTENAYIRQFGRDRECLFWIQDRWQDLRELLIPQWWARHFPKRFL